MGEGGPRCRKTLLHGQVLCVLPRPGPLERKCWRASEPERAAADQKVKHRKGHGGRPSVWSRRALGQRLPQRRTGG